MGFSRECVSHRHGVLPQRYQKACRYQNGKGGRKQSLLLMRPMCILHVVKRSRSLNSETSTSLSCNCLPG